MKSVTKSLLAASIAASMTLSAAPAMAQELTMPVVGVPEAEAPANETATGSSSGSTGNVGTVGALVGMAAAGIGAVAATQGPAPLLDIAKIQEGFTNPQFAPYTVAFTAGVLGISAVLGTMIGLAVG